MILLYVLIIWQVQALSPDRLNMYNTDHGQDRYCLLYYVLNDIVDYHQPSVLVHQIIPYCLRSFEENIIISNIDNTIDHSYTFAELQEKNVTSQQLLSWSAAIELAEQYQFFLNNKSDLSSLSGNETSFHNCTSSWFGPYCQFTFDMSTMRSLDEIVALYFRSKSRTKLSSKVTCYQHLNCETSWLCLDWREICDRKVDCLDGSDELNCWQLEINECDKDEYRCYNGQCIPLDFFHDVPLNPDCLDRTDESQYYHDKCPSDPAFRCEEHSCRPGEEEFPCGDGACTVEMGFKCKNGRDSLLLNDSCLIATACLMKLYDGFNIIDEISKGWCKEFCEQINCSEDGCSSLYKFPPVPILFGHVHFVFHKAKRLFDNRVLDSPIYVCYDEKLCINFFRIIDHFNGSSCTLFSNLKVEEKNMYATWEELIASVKTRFRTCLVVLNETHYCSESTMYQCKNFTKCISKHRLVDGISDCPFNDDETYNQSCSLTDIHNRFTCSMNHNKRCFALLAFQDSYKGCSNGKNELEKNVEYEYANHISFHKICDGIEELLPMLIDERNETDETNCEYWACNNTYTRCDGFWACKNGVDEVNCPYSICPELQHMCVFPNDAFNLSCLPIDRAGDGNVDCLGATDERSYCQSTDLYSFEYEYRCLNGTQCIAGYDLCDVYPNCPLRDDEVFCESKGIPARQLCFEDQFNRTKVENFLCNFVTIMDRSQINFFILRSISTYPPQITSNSISATTSKIANKLIQSDSSIKTIYEQAWLCNRGLPIYISMNADKSDFYCLCPPSYYGDRCQYQNQRVSLSVQIRVVTNWRSEFTFIIMLIDDMQNIESHDYIEYLPVRDCSVKFNVYLLYSTRPKNPLKNYSVQIDTFNKLTSNYQGSWIYPIRFSFLPVYRLSISLKVPFSNVEPVQKCTLPCVHGRCFPYVNDPSLTFCRCEPDWPGAQCNIKYTCDCAHNALCIDKSICLCPVGQFGPRCYLSQSLCPSDSCINGGQCVFDDERYTSTFSTKFKCICSEEYFGDRCEHRRTRIDISFHNELFIPQSLFVHFISVHDNAEPDRTSTMKKIAFDQNSLLIYTSTTFNIAFGEMFGNYYLIILQEQNIISANITTQIIPSHRCVSIHELFNKTLANQHVLKRIKYYHVPCEKQLDLVCFYDDIHFCLCDLYRRTNCFKFNHNMTYDCYGFNMCENGGHCFQNDPKCPTSSTCVCPECYYGSRCQFSAKGSTLSLDAILGYGIHPNIPINRQPSVVKTAITLITLIFVFGLFSNFFLFITFYTKKTCDVGCGFYLRTSSIVSMITISILIIKFWFLLTSQMGSIKNRSFMQMQCTIIDFLLRLLVSSGDWLSACVAIERAVNVSSGVNFNKAKSKQVAKWMIFIVFLLTSCTHIHDPIHRYLIHDDEEQRTWCVTKYSSSLQTFDLAMNILHFSFPFGINCISAFVIITVTARMRSAVRKAQSYKQHLRIQFREHKHLLISPCILVLLALPRLIISFLSGCMKSARNPWLYLIGYFISFIPTIMTFIVFVLPSELYRKEFRDSMKRFWSN